MKNLLENIAKIPEYIKRILLSVYTYILLFAGLGTTLIGYGANLVFGQGISLIVTGVILLIFMVLIARGAARG